MILKRLSEAWKDLNRTIYTGDRLRENLRALTAVSIFTAALGLALIALDLVTGQIKMLIPSLVTLLCGAGCAYLSGVKKDREKAILIPTAFCILAFTYYTFTGFAGGTGILWSFLLPIGMSYFVSVKYGIFLSIYYTLLFTVICYTPLRTRMGEFYNRDFIVRLPLLYGSMSAFTAIAMVQYHRSILLENEYTERLNAEVEKQTRVARERADRLELMGEEVVNMLAVAIDAKDRYTNGHSFRVAAYAVALAEHLRLPAEEIKALRREAMLHDIGKIGVPDAVLNKPGRLTAEEFEVIQSHAEIGGQILARSSGLEDAADVARFHHERYDGGGYPTGRAGEQIPLHARIVTVADAYDAMRSDRIYRKGLAVGKIRAELIEGRGTQFDPALLDAFVELADSGVLDEVTERAKASLARAVELGLIGDDDEQTPDA